MYAKEGGTGSIVSEQGSRHAKEQKLIKLTDATKEGL